MLRRDKEKEGAQVKDMKPPFPCCFFFVIIFSLLKYSAAQNATTDPSEGNSLVLFYQQDTYKLYPKKKKN